MIASVLFPPIGELTFILGILIAVAGAAWVAWVIGYEQGFRAREERDNDPLRRRRHLPPRPQR
jgi:hypothetical protein